MSSYSLNDLFPPLFNLDDLLPPFLFAIFLFVILLLVFKFGYEVTRKDLEK